FCFFFSSRRRHTRCLSDWSSDVCSSDLTTMRAATRYRAAERVPPIVRAVLDARDEAAVIFGAHGDVLYVNQAAQATLPPATITRSEERRVGKECRSRWSTEREKNTGTSR